MRVNIAGASDVTVHMPPLPITFGTHHSKAFILSYAGGLRVIIHTANLIHNDNNTKSQSLWYQVGMDLLMVSPWSWLAAWMLTVDSSTSASIMFHDFGGKNAGSVCGTETTDFLSGNRLW